MCVKRCGKPHRWSCKLHRWKRSCEVFADLVSLCATRYYQTAMPSNAERRQFTGLRSFLLQHRTVSSREMSSFALILRFGWSFFFFFYPCCLWGMRPHLSPVTIYTLFHHKVLQATHAHPDRHTYPTPSSCLIQTGLMSPLTDPHRVSSTHAHRHSITG